MSEELDNLHMEVARLEKELWLRSNLAHVVSTYTHLDELLPKILRFLVDGLGASGGAIYFLDNESDVITVEATIGFDPKYAMEYHSIHLGSHVTGVVAKTGEGMIIKDSQVDRRSTEGVVKMLRYRSALVFPVTSAGEVMGIVALISEKPEHFNEKDLKFIEDIEGHISLAIVNSLLNEIVANEKDMVDDILERTKEGIFEAEVKVPRNAERPVEELVTGFLRSCRFTLLNPSFNRQTDNEIDTGNLLIKGFEKDTLGTLLTKALRSGSATEYERKQVCGEDRIYEVSMVRVMDQEGIKGVKGIRRDITERVTAEQRLQEAKAQTELYLDILSHDISNINTVAMGFLELLFERHDITPVTRSYVNSSLEAVRKSSQLINRIRTFSKLQKGPLELDDVDLLPSLKEAADRVKEEHPEKKTEIVIGNQKGKLVIKGDELAGEMFYHLLKNAVLYNPRDSALVEVSIKSEKHGGRDAYLISIDDRGEGIPDDIKEKVFDRFERIYPDSPETGLGLSIVKGIVNRYSGEIWVEDRVEGEPGLGASLKVRLPRA